MVRNIRYADGSEEDRILVPQLVQPVIGHHSTMPPEVFGSPVVTGDFEGQAIGPPFQGGENLESRLDDLRSDPVGRNSCDLVTLPVVPGQHANSGNRPASSSNP